MPKLIIVYDPQKGVALADGRIANYVEQAIRVLPDLSSGQPYRMVVGSELVIQEFRVAIKQGRILTDDIGFEFEGKIVQHHANGRFADWPEGFCGLVDAQLTALVD